MSNGCIAELNRVCRLCGERDGLISIFNVRYLDVSESLQDVISETVSVKVDQNDCISRNICTKCMNMVIQLFKFRRQAIENDQLLKKQHALAIKRNEDVEAVVAIDQRNISNNGLYRQIKLPNGTFNVFSNPFIVMDINVVENYFKKNKLNMKLHVRAINRTYRPEIRWNFQKRKTARQQPSHDNKMEISDTKTAEKDSSIDSITVSSTHESNSNDNKVISHSIDLASSTDSSASSISQPASTEDNPFTNTKPFSSVMEFDTRCAEAHMCGICNVAFDKRYHLKKHMLNHLNCQFCKRKFKTQKGKEKHVSNECNVMNALNGASTLHVPLQKIERDLELVSMYYSAFKIFPEILPADFLADKIDDSDKEDNLDLFRLYIEPDDEEQSQKEDLQDPINATIEGDREELSIDCDDQQLVDLIVESLKGDQFEENNLRVEGSSPNFRTEEHLTGINNVAIEAIECNDNPDFSKKILQPFKLTQGPLKSTFMKNYNCPRIKIIKALVAASNKFKAKARTEMGTQTLLVPDIKKSRCEINEDTKFGTVLLENALPTLSICNIPIQIKLVKNIIITCKRERVSPPLKLKLEDWDHLPLNDIDVEENATVVTSENIS
ncbi:unnamed protein product [Phyllotreta striolata]|uniref:ZAD domain-containing protein n=1 Tax=Phyllotreta striolata TaxID=444603 RepID=A0A9N9TH01_PHYSR|nr:unnamed protein product [Phyllotreta striolata]